MNQQLQAVKFNEEFLAERQLNINKLARGVEEISELFQTISILTSEQGDTIDNIETNINNSLGNINKANLELKKAEKYQKKKKKFLFIFYFYYRFSYCYSNNFYNFYLLKCFYIIF